MLCQAQRLNPFAGDAFLVGYDSNNGPSFSLITAHQAFLKRAETCKDFEGMESGIIIQQEDGVILEREGDFHLEDENIVGGWARVHRTGRKATYRRIRMSRFNKGFAQWKEDAAGMIVKCAEADALRSTFPSLLGGLYLQSEMDDAAGKIVTESTKSQVESRLVELAPIQEQAQAAQNDPDQPSKELQPAAASTPQRELEQFVTTSGFSFTDFQKLATQEQLVKDADSLSYFDDLSDKDAARLLRAKTGLLNVLKQIKEAA
jgi:phage recombination protein Bet